MIYENQFLSSAELDQLKSAVSVAVSKKTDNFNTLYLTGIDDVTRKIASFMAERLGQSFEYHSAFIFLASDSTMKYGKQTGKQPNWHTDLTCSVIDGDCYNAWIPLHNDADESGIGVITEQKNPEIYQQLNEPTYPLSFYHKDRDAAMFSMLSRLQREAMDLLIITPHTGAVIPLNTGELQIEHLNKSKAGDLALFKQTEIHGGFHHDGIRIQISLKFRSTQAKLNRKPSNTLFPIFNNVYHNLMGQPQFKSESSAFSAFEQLGSIMLKSDKLSKHATLKYELIKALLK